MLRINYLLITFLVVFISCDITGESQSGSENDSIIEEGPTIVDNRLHFDDFGDFNDHIENMINSDFEEITSWENNNGFTSLRKATEIKLQNYLKGKSVVEISSDSLEAIELVEDPYFASLLNEDGLIQIDSVLIKVTRDYVYLTYSKNEHLLKEIGNNAAIFNSDEIIRYEVIRPNLISDGNKLEGISNSDYSTQSNCHEANWMGRAVVKKQYDSKRRLKGTTWNVNWQIFSSFGTKTKNQKDHGIFGWHRAEADEVGLDYEYKYEYKIVDEPWVDPEVETEADSKSEKNASRVQALADFSTAIISTAGFSGSLKDFIEEKAKSWKVHYFKVNHWVINPNRVEGCTQLHD